VEIRPLTGIGWDVLAAAFTEAFSDYAVPMTMTADALANMQLRRGYAADVSFGAFDGARLVGFVLTCRDGGRVYNSGTGVVPSHRRRGLARALVDAVIASAPAPYVLEVLESNARAIALYRELGFVETRRLRCWTYAIAGDPQPAITGDLEVLAADADVELSWQNSLASIARAPEPHTVIGDDRGAAVVFPGTADLALLVVRRANRRRGHGKRLLAAAAHLAGRPLKILNIDARATEIAAFLDAAGAQPLVTQLEMMRPR